MDVMKTKMESRTAINLFLLTVKSVFPSQGITIETIIQKFFFKVFNVLLKFRKKNFASFEKAFPLVNAKKIPS